MDVVGWEGRTELEFERFVEPFLYLLACTIITHRRVRSEKNIKVVSRHHQTKLESYLSGLLRRCTHNTRDWLSSLSLCRPCNKYVSTSKSILRAFISQALPTHSTNFFRTKLQQWREEEDAWNRFSRATNFLRRDVKVTVGEREVGVENWSFELASKLNEVKKNSETKQSKI